VTKWDISCHVTHVMRQAESSRDKVQRQTTDTLTNAISCNPVSAYTTLNQSLISIRPAPVFRKCRALGNGVSKSQHVLAQFKGSARLSTVLREQPIIWISLSTFYSRFSLVHDCGISEYHYAERFTRNRKSSVNNTITFMITCPLTVRSTCCF